MTRGSFKPNINININTNTQLNRSAGALRRNSSFPNGNAHSSSTSTSSHMTKRAVSGDRRRHSSSSLNDGKSSGGKSGLSTRTGNGCAGEAMEEFGDGVIRYAASSVGRSR